MRQERERERERERRSFLPAAVKTNALRIYKKGPDGCRYPWIHNCLRRALLPGKHRSKLRESEQKSKYKLPTADETPAQPAKEPQNSLEDSTTPVGQTRLAKTS